MLYNCVLVRICWLQQNANKSSNKKDPEHIIQGLKDSLKK